MRRLAITVLLLAVAASLWLGLLWLHVKTRLEASLAASALDVMGLGVWTGLIGGLVLAVTLVLGAAVLATDLLPAGWAKGQVRQVQCDECRAVFFIGDTGIRPITHRCPNCRNIGVYDGRADPVGVAPLGSKDIVKLSLKCRNCAHRFTASDTGFRPLRITCPQCDAVGSMQ